MLAALGEDYEGKNCDERDAGREEQAVRKVKQRGR